MRNINIDSLPHMVNCSQRIVSQRFYSILNKMSAKWWGVTLGKKCVFDGSTKFRRHPLSLITIGNNCTFLSSHASNFIGINHPCIIATLAEGSTIQIGHNCGFSGTSFGCAELVELGEGVRCGANTLITDTDWHMDDPRTGKAIPVRIGKNVWLGYNVSVLKGVSIGENTIVGAGSLVTQSLPSNVIAAGFPAKVIRRI